MRANEAFDVVVIGGGPAGSTAGTLLSQWGYKVLVLEKESFPRHHVGESLLPGTLKVMKRLGISEQVEKAGYTKKFGATYVWGKSRTPWTIRFSEIAGDHLSYSFQVDRAKFDKLLLDHTRACGATVKEQCRASGFLEESGRIVGVQYVDKKSGLRGAECRICIDASGQSSLLARRLSLRDLNPALRNIALYAYFTGGGSVVDLVPDLTQRDSGNIFIVATESGWIWYIPLGNGRFSVGLVTSADTVRGASTKTRDEFYRATLARTPEIAALLRSARMESKAIMTISDWSYVARRFQGPGFILVGDSACFIDPILSTGVDLAMEGAQKAAFAINTSLSEPELTIAAMEWYEDEYRSSADSFRHMAEHWYHGQRDKTSWFWEARKVLNPDANMSMRQAFIMLSSGINNHVKAVNQPPDPYYGGFSSTQLKIIYERLDGGRESGRSAPRSESAPTSTESIHRVTRESCLRLNDNVRFRSYMSYMASRDNRLAPVIQMLREGGKLAPLKVVLSTAAGPVLERLNGRRSVGEIVDEVSGMFGRGDETRAKVSDAVTSLLQGLTDARLLTLGDGADGRRNTA